MRHAITFLVCAWCLSATAQSYDIRSTAEHHPQTGELRKKYEFFHDMWSEKEVPHGRYSEWAANGEMTVDCHYFEGEMDSLYRSWYMSGTMKEVSWWKNGQRNGMTRLYDREGALVSETAYKADQLDGLVTLYHPNGRVKTILQYRNGRKHGHETHFNRRGKRRKVRQYEEGKRVRKKKPKAEKGEQEKGKKKNNVDAPSEQDIRIEKGPVPAKTNSTLKSSAEPQTQDWNMAGGNSKRNTANR